MQSALRVAVRTAKKRTLSALGGNGRIYLSTSAVAGQAKEAPSPVPMSELQDSFMNGASGQYIDGLRDQYDADPQSVDPSWAAFFRTLDQGANPAAISAAFSNYRTTGAVTLPAGSTAGAAGVSDPVRTAQLIRAFQVGGHTVAKTDPLGLLERPFPTRLDPAYYGFTAADMDKPLTPIEMSHTKGFLGHDVTKGGPITLARLLERLQDVYCGAVGYEYMHIPDAERCNWIRERIELLEKVPVTKGEQLQILDRLAWSEHFETFLANKFVAAKRFGLEGAEGLIPGMKTMIDRLADLGAEQLVIGMPHRGRLNILGNVVRKPLSQIFHEFSGKADDDLGFSTGDVKYHLGTSFNRPTSSGKNIHLSLLANPSHLEAVNTLVMGKVKAKQFYRKDVDRTQCVPMVLHGDGAFSGQGILYETLDISTVPDYDVGGVIHIVVNNQVAFTTDAKHKRSMSPYSYCTDVARGLSCPVFHVNGDSAEDVVRVFKLAAEWRQKWRSDVVIDLVCYRKFGHNEIDEPMFTQPAMYKVIKSKKNPYEVYRDQLIDQGAITADEAEATTARVMSTLGSEFEESKNYVPRAKEWLDSYWAGFKGPHQQARIRNTGVPMEMILEVGSKMTELPPTSEFIPHRAVKKLYESRREACSHPDGLVDWGTAEALAFGTLLREGFHVRLSGQDVERGTFSHRHAKVHDQKGRGKYATLDHVYEGQPEGQFSVTNSSLSEFGILGYDLGYSLENPNALVMWEAQFGDFANSAQIIFDQFLSSGEAKWLRQSGLVCMLPHGYDGQGPEHSSARLERFLQMTDEDPYHPPTIDEGQWFRGGHLGSQTQECNWQICNVSTPANYFHLLRRQVHREFRKPLILMSPKALLRHPSCKSPLYEFDDIPDDEHVQGVRFKRLIMDTSSKSRAPNPPTQDSFERLIFCSGKVYYDLDEKRTELGLQSKVAIVRIEQLSPFPFDLVSRELRRFPNAKVMWVQEEPQNMGAYQYAVPRVNASMRQVGIETNGRLPFAGRRGTASPSTGFISVHKKEQEWILNKAMDLSYTGVDKIPMRM